MKYSTVQNWYPGDENGKGGVLNLVTKRGDLRGVSGRLYENECGFSDAQTGIVLQDISLAGMRISFKVSKRWGD